MTSSKKYVAALVEEVSRSIYNRSLNPAERAFSRHLDEIAKALDLLGQWDQDGTMYMEAQQQMTKVVGAEHVLVQAIDDALSAKGDLEEAIKVASKLLPCAVEYRP